MNHQKIKKKTTDVDKNAKYYLQPNNGEEKKCCSLHGRDDRAKMNTNCEDVIPLNVYFKADMEFVEIESRAGLPVFELNLCINQ